MKRSNRIQQFTCAYLHHRLDYNAVTGEFMWNYYEPKGKWWNSRYANKKAGCISSNGYIDIRLNDIRLAGHIVAWRMTYDEIPFIVDHINHIRHDNRICNLRNATHAESCHNVSLRKDNVSGSRGVSFTKSLNPFRAYITVNCGKQINLGYHSTVEMAKKARDKAEAEYFGEFANILD
jgi:hypothetical protein